MKIESKPQFTLFLIFTACAVLMRTIKMLFLSDLVTGTLHQGYETLSVVFVAAYVLLGVLSVMLGFFSNAKKRISRRNPLVGVAAALLAAAMLSDAIICFTNLMGGRCIYGKFLVGEVLMSLLLLFSSVYFFLLAGQKTGLLDIVINPALPAVAALQMLVRLLLSFMKYTGYADIGENSYSVVMMVSFLVFWIFYSRAAIGLGATEGNKMVFAPMLAFFCACLTMLPRLLSAILGSGIFSSVCFSLTDIAMILFTIAIATDMFRAKRSPEVTQSPSTQPNKSENPTTLNFTIDHTEDTNI